MRLLVTGGAGFIGSNFIRHVLRSQPDVQVTNLDLLTYAGNLATLRDVEDSPRYRFVHGDIGDAALVDGLVGEVDAIVNFAAETHVDRSITGPAEFLRTNVAGAGVLFDAGYRHGVERFLHISTDEVYGSIEAPGSFHEDSPLEPNSPYSATKAGADLLARAYRETYGYPILVTRTANNFGPYQFPEKALPLFVTNLIDGKPVPVYGDGLNVRDWTYVDDNAAAQWMVLTEGAPGEVYNVGAGNELTNLELVQALLAQFERSHEPERWIEHVEDRAGHDRRYSVDTRRIRALGWKPAHSFDEALAETIAWYRANEAWWRPLVPR
jgi:dTDP-glucose 4,6-dehydratase